MSRCRPRRSGHWTGRSRSCSTIRKSWMLSSQAVSRRSMPSRRSGRIPRGRPWPRSLVSAASVVGTRGRTRSSTTRARSRYAASPRTTSTSCLAACIIASARRSSRSAGCFGSVLFSSTTSFGTMPTRPSVASAVRPLALPVASWAALSAPSYRRTRACAAARCVPTRESLTPKRAGLAAAVGSGDAPRACRGWETEEFEFDLVPRGSVLSCLTGHVPAPLHRLRRN
mmetsp:Transcript_5592/g.12701  ORF Transcript_5592/g.12701 Transcript_5592/m.12701 type:complete len:227 (+) Transcript_5592:515-1195(+)